MSAGFSYREAFILFQPPIPSEQQADGKLQVARAATAEKGIADADVGRDGERQETAAAPGQGINTMEAGVGGERGQQGRSEVRMIEEIENLCAQLEFDALVQRRRLKDREIEVAITRPNQRVAAQTPEVHRARQTRGGAAIARRVECAGHFEGGEIQETIWPARTGEGIADQIGAREEFARAVVVVEQV